MKDVRGTEAFVGTLLMLAGVLNLAFGIAAVANSHFYVGDTHYLFSSLHTWGWIVIILGIVQITASRRSLAAARTGASSDSSPPSSARSAP